MVGALWTGISGLAGHQTALDNESNNIANVNTIGYKASRVSFADQIYQDQIGKGVTIIDVEKTYTQGNIKVTGVEFDMALGSDGFFQVADGNDTYYTRAGNFRMGESGTLQDVSANEVQGWAMSDITSDDIESTDPNATVFSNDYSKILGNKIIRDTTTVETIATKATDYTQSAESDDKTIYTGAGYKSASTKISDVELLITEYSAALSLYAEADPKPTASSSSTQKDLLNFPLNGTDLAEGDEVYAYVDGVKYSTAFDTDNETTMKNLADEISDSTGGYRAYLTDDTSDPYNFDTETAPELGFLVIEGLIPGKNYTISEFGWTDSSNDNTASKGDVVSINSAVLGTGLGHIDSIEEAMAEAISGKQLDVYTPTELAFSSTATENIFTYQIEIYDNDSGQNITVPDVPVELSGGSVTENATVTFTDIEDGADIVVAGITIANTSGATVLANDVAEAIELFISGTASPINGLDMSGSLTGYTASSANGDEIVFTITTPDADVADLSITSGTAPTTPPTVVVVDGAASGSGYTDDNDGISALAADINANDDLNQYIRADNINGNLVIRTLDNNNDVEFSGDLETTVALPETQTVQLSGTATETTVTFLGTDVTVGVGDSAGAIATAISAVQADIISAWNAKNSTREIESFSVVDDVITISYELTEGNVTEINNSTSGGISIGTSVETQTGRTLGDMLKSANYSGRAGASAEFLSITSTINQTASKSEIQLRLDSLSLTDSAFGAFSVDDSGLVTIKQDGVEFAVGQVAVARFTDNRGLEAVGDNLLQATTRSGSAIFNTDNDKMAEITGGSLELSTADLSESLVNLMVFQRAFEANAKSITTADGILTTLIQLKSR